MEEFAPDAYIADQRVDDIKVNHPLLHKRNSHRQTIM